jgi:hypothetical protein
MKALRKSCIALAAAALASGCAGTGGGSGSGATVTANGETREIGLGEALACIFTLGLCPALRGPSSGSSTTQQTATNVRTHMGYGTDGGLLRPQSYAGAPDGPYVAAEVQIQYDSTGRLVLFEPGGFYASGAPAPRYASLERAGLPWLDAGSSPVAGAPASPFTTGQDAQVALVANPNALGWNYQSFGVWNTATATGGAMHASSFGAPTPASAVPTSGTATFTGKLAGLYISPGGQGSTAAADLSVRADFRTRSLDFRSSGTVTTRDLRTPVVAPGLNLAGTLTYQPGSSAFSGTLGNAAGTMSGTTSGKFYGPAAQELGGVLNLRAPGSAEAFTGAYGAKR